jgi:dUTP pyrophosphatase
MSLQVKLLSATARAPTRGSAYAAGYDLYASQATVLPARGRALVPTDISIALPGAHTYGRVAPRSGLALKHGIDTGAGVIDADYRGPVGVILFNHSDTDFEGMSALLLAKVQTNRSEIADFTLIQYCILILTNSVFS